MKQNKESDLTLPLQIVNEDGTDTNFEYPENPLKDKWDKLYPPTRDGKPCGPVLGYKEDGLPIMNYTCVLCHEEKCQHSSYWKVPEEDREEWEKYRQAVLEYHKIHNPSMVKTLESMGVGQEE